VKEVTTRGSDFEGGANKVELAQRETSIKSGRINKVRQLVLGGKEGRGGKKTLVKSETGNVQKTQTRRDHITAVQPVIEPRSTNFATKKGGVTCGGGAKQIKI